MPEQPERNEVNKRQLGLILAGIDVVGLAGGKGEIGKTGGGPFYYEAA